MNASWDLFAFVQKTADVKQAAKILKEGFIVFVIKATVCIGEQYAEVRLSVGTLVYINRISYTL